MKNVRTAITQAGLTLIELAVVLAILVALSTLMVPYVGSFIGKAEVATSNYNSAAVLSALQQYYALNQSYPNNLDLLSDGVQPVSYLDDTAQVGTPGFIKQDTGFKTSAGLSTNFGTMGDNGAMAASMAKVGVTSYFYLKTGTPIQDPTTREWTIQDPQGFAFNATFGSQDVSNANQQGFGSKGEIVLSQGVNSSQKVVMWVSDNCGGYWMQGHPECLANIMGYRNCKIESGGSCPLKTGTNQNGKPVTVDQGGQHMFILLGINQNNEMILPPEGKVRTMTTAPVHFPENKTTNPGLVYSRFLAVFDVDMRGKCWQDTVGCDPAQLVGVVVGPDATRGWQTSTTGLARAFTPTSQ